MKHIIKINNKNCFLMFISIITFVLIFNIVISSPPTPHNVRGRVFNSDGITGVENGIPVRINDTNNSNSVLTYVYAPPIPSLKGSYSAAINSSDNDLINVTAWNSTHYGWNTSYLASTTTDVNIIINIIRPSETNVTITDPANNTVKGISTVFNVTAKIAVVGGQSGTGCYAEISLSNENSLSLYNDNYIHSLENIALGSYKTTTWNVTGIKEGSSNITVNAYCDSDGINFNNLSTYTVYDIIINDTILPNITLINPSNNSWTNKENLTFQFNAADVSGIKSCGIYVNYVLKKTENNFESGSLSDFNLTDLGQGNHSWFVSCYDNSSNQNLGNSSISYINIDLTYPDVTSILPGNENVSSNNLVIFEYNVTDDYGIVDNCSLILNGSVYDTNYSITQNVTLNFKETLPGNYYEWVIICIDKANNSGYSETRFINITDPDLAVYSSDIEFSKENPVENEEVIINATLYNIGNDNATNVLVQFFEDEPYTNQIGSNIYINLSVGENAIVSKTWTAKVGLYNIYVVIDPPYETNGSIQELDESNNVANKTIFIPAYHIYYGDIVADLLLASASDEYVRSWFNETNINGNIYVADSDSSINWTSLFAIGTDLGYNPAQDDFEEIDSILNLTELSDSINNSYTENGEIKASDSFVVYGNNFNHVSIVYSTNTFDFITGILWDYSDLNPGEYNGSQDLIFITKVNQNKQGRYGIYDYEIKVPASLKRYATPNNENTVTFYVELS